jgi:hypothetical protein
MLLKEGIEVLCLWAQYQASFGEYLGFSIVPDPSSQIKEPKAGAPQPRPTPCYKVFCSS